MGESLAAVDEMYLEGIAMKRAQIRREHPEFTDELVDEFLQSWIIHRPMDSPGRIRLT